MGAEGKSYSFIVSGNIISEWVFMDLINVGEEWLRMVPCWQWSWTQIWARQDFEEVEQKVKQEAEEKF